MSLLYTYFMCSFFYVFLLMIRRQPRSTRTDTPFPYTTLFRSHSKTDRQFAGITYRVPALSRWCPVTATLDWISHAGLTTGPLFRSVARSGSIGICALHSNSVVALLRRLFVRSGLASPETYSGHSLRRGFAGWRSEERRLGKRCVSTCRSRLVP